MGALPSIGAGQQQQVIYFSEQLSVRNVIIEPKEVPDGQTLQKVRKLSSGLSFQDLRIIRTNLDGISAASPRKRFTPSKLLPRPLSTDLPVVYGVTPSYKTIGNLQVPSCRFFDEAETTRRGARRRAREGGDRDALRRRRSDRQIIKVNDQWFRVIGIARAQLTVQSDVSGILGEDLNNIVYVPLYSAVFRLEDGQSAEKDEIDGIYLQMNQGADITGAAALIRGILDVAHRGAGDCSSD